MAESVTCLECGASIEINGPITEDTMITCDECGAEYDPRKTAIGAAKKKAVAAVKGDINKMLRKATAGNKYVKVRKR